MKRTLVLVVACASALGLAWTVQDGGSVTSVAAKDIKWVQAKGMPDGWMTCVVHGDPSKGASVTMSKAPAGALVKPHTHSADETVAIVSGSVLLGQGDVVDESKATLIEAGGYANIPAKVPHWAKVKSDVVFVRSASGAHDITFIEKK